MRELTPTGSSANPLDFRKLLFRNDDNESRRGNRLSLDRR
jgi:hypothetical protein